METRVLQYMKMNNPDVHFKTVQSVSSTAPKSGSYAAAAYRAIVAPSSAVLLSKESSHQRSDTWPENN